MNNLYNTGIPPEYESIVQGDYFMHAKTIYNWAAKTVQQRGEIILTELVEFDRQHPGYDFDTWRYEDGKNGERTIFLMFKKRPDA